MFPYPSGHLHMGHAKVYGTGDVFARYFTMKGKNVLYPIGWDAFGLPAENAAIERGINPNKWTQKNIADMKSVMEMLNFGFDWDREFATCDSEYYRWTQFFFIKLFEMGLVYQKKAFVNWDPVDKTVLADEQVDVLGHSWRSGAPVEKKLLRQWFIKTTVFAKSLLDGLQDPVLKNWHDIIDIQRTWIGKVNGTTIDFEIVNVDPKSEKKIMSIWMTNPEYIDKAKFVAVKPNSFWTVGSEGSNLMPYNVKNPFTGELIPVFQTNAELFADGADVHLGIPELSKSDREFADSNGIRYTLEGRHLVGEDELLKLREELCAEARERGIGGHSTSSNLRDWLISRQRYWGTPIPIVHCSKCGEQPVPEEELPVRLPEVKSYGKGANPLENVEEWVNTKCPKCGGDAKRETDTMDTFVDSSWYYLRYVDPDNQEAAFDVKKVKKFLPVDIYVGGKEHAMLHLFYARFMNHFLHSLGLVPHREPFAVFLGQGIVKAVTYKSPKTFKYVSRDLVEEKDGKAFHKETNEVLSMEWEKMSKSKQNSVEPLKIVAKHGVDMLRLVILGASSPKSELNWNENIFGEVFKWQRRLWLTVKKFIKLRSLDSKKPAETKEYKTLDFYIYDSRNYYLQKITHLIEVKYDIGTALRKMQGLTNSLRKCNDDVFAHSLHFERALALQIILLAPVTPYFASELWSGFAKASNRLCLTGEISWDQPVFLQPFPQVDPDYGCKSNWKTDKTQENVILENIQKMQDHREKKAKERKMKKKIKKINKSNLEDTSDLTSESRTR